MLLEIGSVVWGRIPHGNVGIGNAAAHASVIFVNAMKHRIESAIEVFSSKLFGHVW